MLSALLITIIAIPTVALIIGYAFGHKYLAPKLDPELYTRWANKEKDQ